MSSTTMARQIMLWPRFVRRGHLAILFGAAAWLFGTTSGASCDERELLATFRSEFVDITPGRGMFPAEFRMGRRDGDASEQSPHVVKLAHAFFVARYEVPQNLWQAVMGSNPSRWKGPRNAVEMLSYDDAVEFCRKVTAQLRDAQLITPRQVVRLPAEAEWEYVCRAGTSTIYSFGDDVGQLNDHAWSTRNAAGNDPPVGAKKANPWSLHDVHGYLWEWCADTWHENYQGAPTDGSVWADGGDSTRAVLRGGSWKDPAERLTSSYRRAAPRDLRDDAVGLRCVLANE
jgi:formylglycine-generating enzyme required for sulfatase activity